MQNNETVLIISDIHNKIDRADKIISSVGADKIIFTGDFFDSFGDSVIEARKTANWLKTSLHKKNRIHLLGNHDVPVAFPQNTHTYCSGWTLAKAKASNEILNENDWNKFKFYHIEQNWLFSHAGLDDSLKTKNVNTLEEIDCYLHEESYRAIKELKAGMYHWIFRAGYARGGLQNVGGLTWLDFDREFIPIDGINQCVGHTPHKDVIGKRSKKSGENWCLDTHLNHYGVLKNGKIEIFNYSDL